MTVLVIGGAASGKSEYAENLLCRLSGDAPKVYVATMEPHGAEAVARIAKHRKARTGKGFVTLERCTNLAGLRVPKQCAVLLEDLGNLCANEMFSPRGSGDGAEASILRGLRYLRGQCAHVVIVSNEIFCGGTAYSGETLRYLRTLARLHREIAATVDGVCEVVCGIPAYYKGAERFAKL
ncbi:MAG: bifunctional adenosylcobinamide kinase/adenosylcobinamide-phosphate guanylyltransferase [Oscillospiraceae bacterium]|nr:bifunctional adenosylcobinamide kinase/adenosylcobinamide-phosphate guanylyltransferase [Oscillospiraceae bacterium]